MGFTGFFKKEINEILKTTKKFVLPAILLFFGFMSPLTARYIREIIKTFSGIDMPVPDPVYIDSFVQYFKNIGQIGIIVMILVFMGTVVEEKVKGSAILVLTKSVSRTQFILSKFLSSMILFTSAYIVSSAAFLYYTYLLFPDFNGSNVFVSLLMLWIYGIFIIALTILASTVSKSQTMAAVNGFIGFAVISSLSMLPKVGKYLPGALSEYGLGILSGTKTLSDMMTPVIVAIGLLALLLLGSVLIFNRQEL